MSKPHVTVCICTFRRPVLLERLLRELGRQETGGNFTYSVIVVDNDAAQSARSTVEKIAAKSSVRIVYDCEPEQNIALTRNRAVSHAQSDYIAFLDDDEFPVVDWLRLMLATCESCAASGVLGPVRPYFDQPPPAWIVKGRFCERPEHPTGTVMEWNKSRTGNLLFRRSIISEMAEPFRRQFGTGGEDVDFFRRMAERGCKFVWCNEAAAYEEVPPNRRTRRYMFERALLRGRNTLKLRHDRAKALAKSAVALPIYSLILPGTLLLGQAVFMKFGIRLCDHLGRVLALFRINPVQKRQG